MAVVTQARIAAELGVATSTVQRALSGSSRISEATRKRVLALARKFNYRAIRPTRNSATRRTQTVGVILANYTPNSLKLFSGVEEELARHGFNAIFTVNECDPAYETEHVRRMLRDGIRALIVYPIVPDNPVYSECIEAGVPVVFYHVGGRAGPLVCDDQIWAGMQVTSYLCGLGHRRIGFTDCSDEEKSDHDCRIGYETALTRAGLPLDPSLCYRVEPIAAGHGEPRYRVYENGLKAVEYLMGLPDPPTAIVTQGDALTAGVVAGLRERGYEIPRDVSVAAANGDYLLRFLWPRVTGVVAPHRDMGRIMASRAIDLIRDPKKPVERMSTVRGQFVVWESTAPPRGAEEVLVGGNTGRVAGRVS